MNRTRTPVRLNLSPAFADCGSLNRSAMENVRRQLRTIAERVDGPVLVLDLSNVLRCGAEFVGILHESTQLLNRRGKRLMLTNVRDDVSLVLQLCRVDHSRSTPSESGSIDGAEVCRNRGASLNTPAILV